MLTLDQLASINEERETSQNVAALAELGGVKAILKGLETDPVKGIAGSETAIEQRRATHGSNKMPEPEPTTWLAMFLESFEDTTVQILMFAAIISLAVGLYEDPAKGWIEGTTILFAVVIVAVVTATNNYKKEAQFRQLNAVKDLIDVSVIRNGAVTQLCTHDIVVGDLISLESGDKIPADGLLVSIKSADGVTCNESAATGESDDKRKSLYRGPAAVAAPAAAATAPAGVRRSKRNASSTRAATTEGGSGADEEELDPFMLSGTTVSSGSCVMVVLAVGPNSRWGRTKAIMPTETENTPLQEKLDVLATQIGYGGMVSAAATFIAMMAIWFYYPALRSPSDSTLFEHILRAFIMAVTIVVVAVPEGLPLAVTVSLAYSTAKMMKDNNLIRVLDACETMGNATNICSDKTGTLTQNVMTVVAGWVAGEEHGPNTGGLPDKEALAADVLKLIAEGIAVNTTATVIPVPAGAPAGTKPVIVGSRTESALLNMLTDVYATDYRTLRAAGFNSDNGDQLFAFSSHRKRMSTLQMPAAATTDAAGSDNGRRNSVATSKAMLFVKGAAEVVLDLCTHVTCGGNSNSTAATNSVVSTTCGGRLSLNLTLMSPALKDQLLQFITDSAKKSLRCVALAHRAVSMEELAEMRTDGGNDANNGRGRSASSAGATAAGATYDVEELEQALVLDAIYCISDPLRPDVTDAIRTCHKAGVVVRMVTGDNVETARAIAKECGILTAQGEVMDGPSFRKLTPAQLDEKLLTLQVLARSSPSDKFNLVARLNGNSLPETQEEWEAAHPGFSYATHKDLLLPGYKQEWEASRASGKYSREVVGVTGDGTNDAPALRVADVGLSMGLTGTEAAKEASDIVILDDNFGSIVKAVLWGRSVYDNIRKFLQFQLTVNIVALLVTFACAVFGMEPPLNAVMMLWVNLIMDTMGALALGTETPSRSMLDRAPYKRDASLISAPLWRNILVQSAFQLALCAYLLAYGAEDLQSTPEHRVVAGSTQHLTFVFNAFVFCQAFNEFNARSIGDNMNVFVGLLSNPIFLAVIVFTVGMQWVIVQYGGEFVKVVPLTPLEWYRSVLLAALTLPVGGLMRLLPVRENPADFAPATDMIVAASAEAQKFSGASTATKDNRSGMRSARNAVSFMLWLVCIAGITAAVADEVAIPFWLPRATEAFELWGVDAFKFVALDDD